MKDGADVLRPRWGFDLHELFGCEDERCFVREAANPVDAVDEGGDLRVGANLGELFIAPVHVSHNRFGDDDLLTIELGDDAQGSVRCRVLRTDVEGHALGLDLDVDASVGGLLMDVAELFSGADGVVRSGR